jgi:Zn-finger nucleic acid-binding protein
MDVLEIEGTQVDRCSKCFGLWFDPGEIDKLRNRRSAAAIDIGDPESGRSYNSIDGYRCPRCGGAMSKLADPLQKHIWYEKCDECQGSYFDAGEFADLATFSLSDFLKRFTVPDRR